MSAFTPFFLTLRAFEQCARASELPSAALLDELDVGLPTRFRCRFRWIELK
jgi:hypothetical protein